MRYLKISIFILIILVLIVLLGIGGLYLSHLYTMYGKEHRFIKNFVDVSGAVASIGSLIVLVFTALGFFETRKMTIETIKQREMQEEPAVSLKIVPDEQNLNFLNIILKNTGGGAAYDVSVNFNPDIAYANKSLNKLNIFKKMPLLDKGEQVSFFFDSAADYFKSGKPKVTEATVSYYRTPKTKKNNKPITRTFNIDIEERSGLYYLSRKDMNDLVNVVDELKDLLLILSIEKKGDKE